jgi:hypothetical protein
VASAKCPANYKHSVVHARYERYKSNTTFADASAAVMMKQDRHCDVKHACVKVPVPPRRKLSAAVCIRYERSAEETRDGSSSAPEPPMPIHNELCPRTRVSASHAPPERPADGTGLGSSSAPGPQVNILIISMDAQRARRYTHALAQAGHVESVQARA